MFGRVKKIMGIALTVLLLSSTINAKEKIRVFWAEYEGDSLAYTQKLVKAFEKENPNIEVQFDRISWNVLHDHLVTHISAKKDPDLSIIGTRWLLEFVSMNVIEPIKKHLSTEFMNNIDPSAMEARIGGTLYGIPVAMGTRIMFYRSDLVDKPPSTFEELREMAKKIHNPPKIYGIGMGGRKFVENTDFVYYLYGIGGDYFQKDKNGKLTKSAINKPEAIQALKFMNDLVNRDKITQPNVTAYTRDETQELFVNGKLGFFLGGGHTAALLKKRKVPFKWGVAQIPSFKGKKKSALLVTDSIVMFKRSKNKKAVAKFIEFIYQDKYRLEFEINTGFQPITKSLAANEAFQTPVLKIMVKSVSGAKGWPLAPEWPQANDIIWEYIENMFQGYLSPEIALKKAAEKIDKMRGY